MGFYIKSSIDNSIIAKGDIDKIKNTILFLTGKNIETELNYIGSSLYNYIDPNNKNISYGVFRADQAHIWLDFVPGLNLIDLF